MNKFYLIIISVLLIGGTLHAQGFGRGGQFGGRRNNKINQLEKLKLIETLNLDEETSVRLFTRRKQFRLDERMLMNKRDSLILVMDEVLLNEPSDNKNNILEKYIIDILSIEEEAAAKRNEFYNSLKDILSVNQIARMITFEMKFKDEIRNLLMQRHRRRR